MCVVEGDGGGGEAVLSGQLITWAVKPGMTWSATLFRGVVIGTALLGVLSLRRRRPKAWTVRAAVLEEGIELCRANARRLADDALTLLDGGATLASVYGQWHLAVEELGKAELLRKSKGSATEDKAVSLSKKPLSWQSREEVQSGPPVAASG